ncbi:MAG: DEAD/DEAH box helicase, partial [Candidatus Micrarchaeales archaeon]
MELQSLKGKLPYEIIESILNRDIKNLTPPQESAIKNGLLDFENMVVAAPTASGKTLIAEIACANAIIGKRMKAVYIAPMRALVMEKYNEFKSSYPYIKCAVSIGDLDSNDQWLQNYDMLFVSTEKFDSLLRHGISWLDRIGCVVFDEIHMIDDSSRGPTLEVLITKLATTCKAQIIALSATIGNADELAKWLKAKLVQSDYRPVKLKKGVMHDEHAYYLDDKYGMEPQVEMLDGTSKIPEIRILEDTLEKKKQILIFYATKRNAEAGATKLADHTEKILTKDEQKRLDAISDEILNALERPTDQCIK